ncbi:MAG: YkgJ family cysteine cluster protein [Myxococcaceae bacterium]|nr:YkgJ family cysteine cluster protein [Myxococcaceae bacterium]MCI0673370.1 YkgJ family cysteine cluster protein [Myxococcaceae bacterium]
MRERDDELEAPEDRRTRAQRERAALGALSVVYREADAAWAPFSCPASGECCQLTKTGRQPWLWRAEWVRLLERLKRDGRPLPPARADGACPFLDDTGLRCSVYADRPLGCRTFFCDRIRGPERQPAEVMDLLQRKLERLSVALDEEDTGPRPLLDWHRTTLPSLSNLPSPSGRGTG